jgi:aarF domain-containing kinase
MTPFAHEALRRAAAGTAPGAASPLRGPRPPHPLVDPARAHWPCHREPANALEERLVAALRRLAAQGLVLGCQVAVAVHGETRAQVSFGLASPYTAAPVTPSTLFNAFSVTKAVVAAMVHRAVHVTGRLRFGDAVARHWPAFGARGKQAVTVAELLRHRAGLQDAGAAEARAQPFAFMADWGAAVRAMEQAAPARGARGRGAEAYHYLSFGWLLGGLLEHATGQPLRELVRELADGLGMDAALVENQEFGIGVELPLLDGGRDRLAVITSMLSPPRGTRDEDAGADEGADPDADADDGGGGSGSEDGEQGSGGEKGGGGKGSGSASNDPGSLAGEGGEQSELMMLSPSLFNGPAFREALIPAANGHFSARALAAFYSGLLRRPAGEIHAMRNGAGAGAGAGAGKGEGEGEGKSGSADDDGRFGYGFTKLSLGGRPTAFGHAGVGGSLAFCDPHSGVAVAVTVNKLTNDRAVTRALVAEVCSALGLGELGGYV